MHPVPMSIHLSQPPSPLLPYRDLKIGQKAHGVFFFFVILFLFWSRNLGIREVIFGTESVVNRYKKFGKGTPYKKSAENYIIFKIWSGR